jgi:hypothetical protein
VDLDHTYEEQELRHIQIISFHSKHKILEMLAREPQKLDGNIHRIYDVEKNTTLHYLAFALAIENILLLYRLVDGSPAA